MSRKRILLTLSVFLVMAIGSFAQIPIKGKIVSGDDNQPMPGVTILLKNTTKGTITDVNGMFEIEVPNEKSILSVSSVGYKSIEVAVKTQRTINLSMQPDEFVMDEVVVMGYSSQRKAELSSSVVTLTAEALTDVTSSDIGNMLQGKAAGVVVYNATGQPGSAAQIRIRGTGSITADAEPLYVVDGVPYGSFNPNDVETLTVLKDAGATALYGSAASGGVIVVTTKSATANQPTRVNFKATAGPKSVLNGNYTLMKSEELYETHRKLYSPALFKQLRPAELLDKDFDWVNAFFSPGVTQNYYVSASGGSGKTGYFASLDYYNEDGTLINTAFERYSGRLNLNTKLNDKLDMNIRLSYTKSNSREESGWETLNDAYTKMPWDIPYDNNGELIKISGATRPDNNKPWYSQDKWNALHSEQYNYGKSYSHGIVADFQLNWIINNWLVFNTTNRFDQSSYRYARFIDPRSFNSSYSKGYIYNGIGLSESFGTTNILKSNNTFGYHNINGLLGWEWGVYNTDETTASGIGMPIGKDALSASAMNSISGYSSPGAGWSVFGQVQYSYAGKYFATGSYRADASSKFGPQKRIGYFPSGAVSWLISQEDFLKYNDVITFLKLRASYGVTGNSNIGSFRYMSMFSLNSTYNDIVGATPERLANPFLGWESAYMAGAGIDINLWKNVELNIDVYNIDNRDLLLEIPVAPSTGFFEKTANVGSVRNQGIELQLNTNNISTKNFLWKTGFNIGFNKNTVIETPGDKPFLQSQSSVKQEVKRGQDIYSWYMPKWMGVDENNGDPLWEKLVKDSEGNIIDRTTTNVFKDADYQVVGKATPVFSGGFINNLYYRNFELNINTNFVYGNRLFNYDRLSMDADGAYLGYNQMSLENSKLGWTRWENPGDVATHPKLVMNGNKASNSVSSRYLEDGSFFRIKNITLAYKLPVNLLKKMSINSCKVYLTTDNVFTLTNFSGMDPEVNLRTRGDQLAGLYSKTYPISRQYLAGIEISF